MTALLCVLLQAGDLEGRVRELAARLASESIDLREEAAADLVALGPGAEGFLRAATAGADVEVRGRAAEILRDIARGAVLRTSWEPPRRVDLSWKDVPVGLALDQLGAALGESFSAPGPLPGRVTLDVKQATGWEAIEALCRAAPALNWKASGRSLAFEAVRRPPYPSKLDGGILVWLEAVEYGSEFDFQGAPRDWAVAELRATWAPGLKPMLVELRASEVLDPAGRNLLAPSFRRPPGAGRSDPALRQVEGAFRVVTGPDVRIDRVRGSALLAFPQELEDVVVPFGQSRPLARDDGQLALRAGTSTGTSIQFTASLSTSGLPPIAPLEAFLVDDEGASHAAERRTLSTAFGSRRSTLHQVYEATLPAGRKAASGRFRVVKDLLERRVDFDFGGLPGR